MKRFHVFISGRVQSVFFRYNTKKAADKLNINGWIRNISDGRVEAVFEGKEEDLKKILNYCKRGPLLAKVTNIEVKKEKVKGEKEFEVVY